MAVDCCEHVVQKLTCVPGSQLIEVRPNDAGDLKPRSEIGLIAIGIAKYPVRRLFTSQLRRIFPDVPILVLRRELVSPGRPEELVRGEFLLSDSHSGNSDCELVIALREILPFPACEHVQRNDYYELIADVIETVNRSYADPSLTILKVAQSVNLSPKRLSLVLNQHVGVSFRNVLRQVRIEQAKRMLITRQYSVKEVAAQVGFTDSHYFSRSFKELTGQNPRDYHDKASTV
jgi:AraC-like DNA-binding protein